MAKSCIALFSGGLDSRLALRLMAMQGIRVVAMNAINCFHGSQRTEAHKAGLRAAALDLGAADIIFPDLTDAVVALTKNPRHGYGRNLNACIDCRLKTVEAGFALMRESGADFVVSGEVIGQRPMSQRRDAIALTDREVASWGFAGRYLRPLSAKLLEKTIPEAEKWVDAERLYGISGRARQEQMALAAEIGVTDYPTPAGGCLLTDAGYSERLAVLMRFVPDWSAADAELLKVGRHFQVGPKTKLVVSRNEAENYRLGELARFADTLYINAEKNGALAMIRGVNTPEAERLAAGLAVHYSKMRERGEAVVEAWSEEGGTAREMRRFAARVVSPEEARGVEAAVLAAPE